MKQTKRYKKKINGTRKNYQDGSGRKSDPVKKIQDATQKIIQNPQTQEVRSKANLKSAGWSDEEIDEFYKRVYAYFNEQPINTLSKLNAKRVGLPYDDKRPAPAPIVAQPVAPIIEPIIVESAVEPVIEPIVVDEPVIEPIVDSVAPIVEPIVVDEPIVEDIVVEPVAEPIPSLLEKEDKTPVDLEKPLEHVNECDYNLEPEFAGLNCDNENFYSSECNKFLLKKELVENKCLAENPDTPTYLYPNLNDSGFNIKIAQKKEFNDTKYDGIVYKNIKEQADIIANAEFELQPHQAFVKNFLSSQTPYSSLLLYHGLGSGKTCSAIGVCEEMRDYMRQTGITKRIMIVASENVQDNFKLQLFDERKLKQVDGLWTIKGCIGNKLINEINPTGMRGISRDKIISQISALINTYYLFLGYGQFANYIIKKMDVDAEEVLKSGAKVKLNNRIIRRLRAEFNDRLIVIDEVHNIRIADDNQNKKVAVNLEFLVKAAQNMRFLFLSATPMYNSYKEIIWLLNLMNTNDRRGRIDVSNIFEANGNFKEGGKELLIQKATGYVSFVRGENPYTFPYRVYPDLFAPSHTFPAIPYPSYQMNLKKIKDHDKDRILCLYLNTIGNCGTCGNCQFCVYKYIISHLRNKRLSITTKTGTVKEMPSFSNMEKFGYTLLQNPIESLIISYPFKGLREILEEIPKDRYSADYSEDEEVVDEEEALAIEEVAPDIVDEEELLEEEEQQQQVAGAFEKSNIYSIDPRDLTGKNGLSRMMNFVDTRAPQVKGMFEYKETTLKEHGKIFSRDLIGKYSSKIKCVLDQIYNVHTNHVSDGVILIYSQYIDGGLIPMALALEEMGFVRYGENVKPLFKTPPSKYIDVRTMKPQDKEKDKSFMPARYTMITGDIRISPDNDSVVKMLTNENNKNGEKIKVILISKAGSEGIDLKFIRQVHILEPWYNMNRIEQIIGRAVRNLSHKDLDFENRNVQIFLYGTILGDENQEEATDLYVFRVAEQKAIQIGKVSRVLKESAVDCILNHDQTNFTQDIMTPLLAEHTVVQDLSTGVKLDNFKIGDAPYSPACDYMAKCYYDCVPNKMIGEDDITFDTYNEHFIKTNTDKIIQRIRMLMRESYFYKKDILLNAIRTPKKYPYTQIYSALTQLIEDNNEFIIDKYGRNGRLVNIGEYYLFQPIELRNKNISIFERSVPIDYKHESIKFEISGKIAKPAFEEPKEVFQTGKQIIAQFQQNFLLVQEFTKNKKVDRGDHDWYKYCGVALQKLVKETPEIKEYILEFVIAHMIELLLFDEKLDLMNYIYSLKEITNKTIEWYSKQYFETNSIVVQVSKRTYIVTIMYKLNEEKIMILDELNTWIEAEPIQKQRLEGSKEIQELTNFNVDNYNRIIGFIGYEKNNAYMVFKTKDMTSKRDRGARCDEAGKDKTISTINAILGQTRYTNENTRLKKDTNGNLIHEAISHDELCVTQELILRYYDKIRNGDKQWFISPYMALYYKLYTIIVK